LAALRNTPFAHPGAERVARCLHCVVAVAVAVEVEIEVTVESTTLFLTPGYRAVPCR